MPTPRLDEEYGVTSTVLDGFADDEKVHDRAAGTDRAWMVKKVPSTLTAYSRHSSVRCPRWT
jgi:hypothetical protein